MGKTISRKTPRTGRKPGTMLQGGQAVVDAHGIARTFPANPDLRALLTKAIERKTQRMEQQKPPTKTRRERQKPPGHTPRVLPIKTVIRILTELGFERRHSEHHEFVHPSLGVINLGRYRPEIGFTGNSPRLKSIVKKYLASGGRL
ncbi:MAG: hypothetical protein Q7K34_01315 [archaeon]|nr:hypothetical protein [archaeon]